MSTAASGLTPEEYCSKFRIGGKKVSPRTIKRCCDKGLLPSAHHAEKFPDDDGQWIIMVPDVEEKQVKAEVRSLNAKHHSWV
jgi:hypothetical protein